MASAESSATDRQEVMPAEQAFPGRWRVLVVTQFAAFMTLLDISIVNVALPSIERDLDVSAATAQWLVSGYDHGESAALATAGPLLLGGLGGGLVTSPNLTLTLQNVPVRMAGAAGGALQTAQWLGGAIGTAVLATIFYRVLLATHLDYMGAVSDAMLCACLLMAVALVMAAVELIRRGSAAFPDNPRAGDPPAGVPGLPVAAAAQPQSHHDR